MSASISRVTGRDAYDLIFPAHISKLLPIDQDTMHRAMSNSSHVWLGFEDKASPRQVHAWYVWDWQHQGPPTIRWAEA